MEHNEYLYSSIFKIKSHSNKSAKFLSELNIKQTAQKRGVPFLISQFISISIHFSLNMYFSSPQYFYDELIICRINRKHKKLLNGNFAQWQSACLVNQCKALISNPSTPKKVLNEDLMKQNYNLVLRFKNNFNDTTNFENKFL